MSKQTPPPPPPAADVKPDAPPPAPKQAPKAKRAPGCYVARGRTITTSRGRILTEGQPVAADVLGGGQGALDRLVERGVVDRVK